MTFSFDSNFVHSISERHDWEEMVLMKSNLIHFLLITMNGHGKQFIRVMFLSERIFLPRNQHLVSAPTIPSISNDEDTSNFNEIEKQDRPVEESFSTNKAFAGNQLSFIGFSFSNEHR